MSKMTEMTAQMIENNLLGTHFTISTEEMSAAQEKGNRVDGKWAEPYLKMTGRIKEGVPRRTYGEGQLSDFTSFATCHPALAQYTMHVTLDLNAMKLVETSKQRNTPFGHGFVENGMNLRGLGMFLCLMLPTPDKKWRLIGHILLDSRYGRQPMIFIEHPDRLPAPNEKGRVYLVARNYEMIERSRLSQTVERNGKIEFSAGSVSEVQAINPDARFRQTRTAPAGFGAAQAETLGSLEWTDVDNDVTMEREAPRYRETNQSRHRAPWEREQNRPSHAQQNGPSRPQQNGRKAPPQVASGNINLKDLRF